MSAAPVGCVTLSSSTHLRNVLAAVGAAHFPALPKLPSFELPAILNLQPKRKAHRLDAKERERRRCAPEPPWPKAAAKKRLEASSVHEPRSRNILRKLLGLG